MISVTRPVISGPINGITERAEAAGFKKNGSVEVLRARLIRNQVMSEHDLSWEGIQAMSHQELGDTLKIFGIKSRLPQREEAETMASSKPRLKKIDCGEFS